MTKDEIRKILSGISIFTLIAGTGAVLPSIAAGDQKPAQTG
jgi:hypothetical protein